MIFDSIILAVISASPTDSQWKIYNIFTGNFTLRSQNNNFILHNNHTMPLASQSWASDSVTDFSVLSNSYLGLCGWDICLKNFSTHSCIYLKQNMNKLMYIINE